MSRVEQTFKESSEVQTRFHFSGFLEHSDPMGKKPMERKESNMAPKFVKSILVKVSESVATSPLQKTVAGVILMRHAFTRYMKI